MSKLRAPRTPSWLSPNRRRPLCAIIGVSLAASAHSAEILVNTAQDVAGDDGVCSLREALASADNDSASGVVTGECVAGSGSDLIKFAPSLAGAAIDVETTLTVASMVTVDGVDAPGMTIGRPYSAYGLQPAPSADVTMTNLAMSGSGAQFGQGFITNDGILRMHNVSLDAGYVGYGVAIRNSGTLEMEGCSVSGSSDEGSGALVNYGDAVLTNTSLSGGSQRGTGVLTNAGSLSLINSTASGSSLRASSMRNEGTLVLVDSVITFSGGGSGGAISNAPSGIIDARRSTIDVYAPYGSALINLGTLSLQNATASLKTDENIGLDNRGQLNVSDTTFEQIKGQFGTGLLNTGTAIVANSSLNQVGSAYSAIVNEGNLSLSNVTLSEIESRYEAGVENHGTATLNHVTIAGTNLLDFYDRQPGIIANFATLTLTNSIIEETAGQPSCRNEGVVESVAGSVVQGGGCGAVRTGDPLLSPLADNGGPTMTYALGLGSPAIDTAADAQCLAQDQRGVARPQDGDGDEVAQCDVGAFEFVDLSAPTIVVNTAMDITADDGQCSLREAIISANSDTASGNFPGECVSGNGVDTITFDPALNGSTVLITPPLEDGTGQFPSIASSVSIVGPGASQLTISPDEATLGRPSRVLRVSDDDPETQQSVSVAGVTLSGGILSDQGDSSSGGGIYNSEHLQLDDVSLSDNFGRDGAGLFNDETGRVEILNSEVVGNVSGGGALCGDGTGILNAGELVVRESAISSNVGCGNGGGISNSGSAKIYNTLFDDNGVDELSGGAIFSSGTLLLMDSDVHGSFGYGQAGAVAAFGESIFENLTIRNSSMSLVGSGATVYASGTVSLENVTISGNSARQGALRISSGSSATIRNVTIANHFGVTAPHGTLTNDGAMSLHNSIIVGASEMPDCAGSGTLVMNTGNLIEDGSCSPLLSGDPMLGPLQNNGGTGLTHALLAGSPAINAGDNAACPEFDQTGVPRNDGQCDIGAFEYVDALPPEASVALAPDVTATGESYEFEIRFVDDVAVDVSSLGDDDLRLSGDFGEIAAELLGVTPLGDGSPRIAQYRATPPGGAWDSGENGAVELELQATSVFDTNGNAAEAAVLGSFSVAIGIPEIQITGNDVEIVDGDESPSPTDATEFGIVNMGDTVSTTFVIRNQGSAVLEFSGTPRISITGGDFIVVEQPPAAIDANETVEIAIRVEGNRSGPMTGTVIVASNDADENPYTFRLAAVGNTAPRIEAGSFMVPVTVAPGEVVGSVSVADDEQNIVAFEIVAGNIDGAFTIDDLGRVVFTGLAALEGDRLLEIRATDAGGLASSAAYSITVDNSDVIFRTGFE